MPDHVILAAGPSLADATYETRYAATRAVSRAIAAPLAVEDMVVQAMPDTSPTKWHLAHVTWFFETFVLARFVPGYRCFDADYAFLFNSYYEGAGDRHARPERGLITRPTVAEVLDYRDYVDAAMAGLLAEVPDNAEVAQLVELGINHEQQHQELMLMDILNLFSRNPLCPTYVAASAMPQEMVASDATWRFFDGGLYDIGFDGNGFSFDSEQPRHRVYLQPFALADRLVTNGEWLAFMEDGGYRRHDLWLADGIARVRADGWGAPLYWFDDPHDGWCEMTLHGKQPINPTAPVGHVSFFEADAFARWSGHRLPTEAEWEVASTDLPPTGNTLGQGHLRPLPAGAGGHDQMFGDLWEWTASPYVAYPGFTPPPGVVGEYNGKFMSGQMVLRGGACVTPDEHLRATYRNFFYPHQRWAFTGLRLAKDVS